MIYFQRSVRILFAQDCTGRKSHPGEACLPLLRTQRSNVPIDCAQRLHQGDTDRRSCNPSVRGGGKGGIAKEERGMHGSFRLEIRVLEKCDTTSKENIGLPLW